MRHQSISFIEEFMKIHGVPRDTLDVGSLAVDGEVVTPRPLFETYTGVDMRKGKNVDIVANSHDLVKTFGRSKFDCVICFDTLEHDDKFWLTLDQMKKVLRRGGWMLIGIPSGRAGEHMQPNDYWRFMPNSIEVLFDGFTDVFRISEKLEEFDIFDEIYAWGRKPL